MGPDLDLKCLTLMVFLQDFFRINKKKLHVKLVSRHEMIYLRQVDSCQLVSKVKIHFLSVLNLVQTVCKGFQQMTNLPQARKELNNWPILA